MTIWFSPSRPGQFILRNAVHRLGLLISAVGSRTQITLRSTPFLTADEAVAATQKAGKKASCAWLKGTTPMCWRRRYSERLAECSTSVSWTRKSEDAAARVHERTRKSAFRRNVLVARSTLAGRSPTALP